VPVDPRKVLDLTDAALSADYTRVRRAANAIARGLAEGGDAAAAEELKSLLRRKGVPLRTSGYAEQLPVDAKSRLPLVEEQAWPDGPVFLDGAAGAAMQDFIADVRNVEELSRQGLTSRLCMLLFGPPGSGKSLLAGHVAMALGRPLYLVRLDSLISSLLGDTAKNVRTVFDFTPAKGAVLFLDEMDAVAKLRDDRHELGELKRVVNTVLQGLDSLDDRAVVIGATNHPQLLDPAIWRRFPYKLELRLPDPQVRAEMWKHFLFADTDNPAAALLGRASEGLSGADIQVIAHTSRRHAVLERRGIDLPGVAEAVVRSTAGAPALPNRQGLTPDARRSVAHALRDRGLAAPQVAALLDVSRQWALKLVKEGGDG
jgi:SpoVK/Ycf46/Vps4 family AAA+-type ATPase